MVTKILSNVNAAIGSRFLKNKNQVVFVEYTTGSISLLNMVAPSPGIVSQGSILLKGTWVFDCETGALDGNLNGPGDIWWEQITAVNRQMRPVGGATIVNLGMVDFASVTPVILQAQSYSSVPIPGNDDPSNQLKTGIVFAVRTNAGNLAKIKVVQYGYNMQINWVTYKIASSYQTIGTGYTNPEDIAVFADETTAYVTERSGNLLKVNLANANRAAAMLIASGLQAPQQLQIDEQHKQAYVVEFANPGRLLQIDLTTFKVTPVLQGLNNAIGLLISDDLAYAYISEQSGGGKITRYSLQGKANLVIASGLTNPFYLSWADQTKTALFVAERDPANRISLVKTLPYPGSVQQVVTGTGARPSSVVCIDATKIVISCDKEIDFANILAGVVPPKGLFKGIGLVPWNLITSAGMADTTQQTLYPYQFAKDSPFGGVLSLQVNHQLASQSGVKNYRILVDSAPRLEVWWDLQLNTANGKYEIPVQFKPKDINNVHGYYDIHQPGVWLMNSDLAMILDSSLLSNGLRNFTIEFSDAAGTVLQQQLLKVLIDNNRCTASIEMPTVNGVSATTDCGMLKFLNKTQKVTSHYIASHPNLFGTYSWRVGKGGKGPVPGVPECVVDGLVSLSPFTFEKEVGALLELCPSAAFYASVYVYAKAINGYGRLSGYDASCIIAFALTP